MFFVFFVTWRYTVIFTDWITIGGGENNNSKTSNAIAIGCVGVQMNTITLL